MNEKLNNLKRNIESIPTFAKEALEARGLVEAYHARPAYQQNDYMLWINSAKRPETKEKRLNQMLDELSTGGVYMRMCHPPSAKD